MGPRHEVRDFLSRCSRCTLLHGRVDVRLTRELMMLSAVHRTVLLGSLGAVVSDLWLFRAGVRASGTCTLCGAALGLLSHFFFMSALHTASVAWPSGKAGIPRPQNGSKGAPVTKVLGRCWRVAGLTG